MTIASDAPALAAADATTFSQRLYRAIWRWHFFAGLLVVPFMISLAVTGGLYLFNDEIDATLLRQRNYVTVSGEQLKPSEIVEKALASVPGATLSTYRTPAAADRTARLTLSTADGSVYAYVDPYSGAVLDTVSVRQEFNEVVRDIHSLDVFGDRWEIIIEIVAGFAIVLVLTGIYLWWPRNQSGGVITVRGTPARRVFWRDLHAVTGIVAGVLILFLAFSGLLWSGLWGPKVNGYLTANGMGYPVQLWDDVPKSTKVTTDVLAKSGWLVENAPVPASESPASDSEMAPPIGINRAVEVAKEAGLAPGFDISPPSDDTGVYTAAIFPVELANERTIHIDQYSGKSLVDLAFAQYPLTGKAIEWGINVHQGREWGLFNQLLMLTTCVAIILSSVTAVVMWWKRRPSGRLGVPPAPHNRSIYAGLWLIAAVFGIAFPLTGIAIAAMIAFDLLVVPSVPPLKRFLS